MYSSCLFCHSNLGTNESVAAFPVGRRLAFDSANGRFWVICASCKRWNLSPLEERWNAIDECERLFESTRTRMSTDNIGLARIAEGTELVRVGKALRPEMAAWRFGAQLAARRQKYRWLVAGGVIATGGLMAGAAAAGVGWGLTNGAWQLVNKGYERATRLVLPRPADSIQDKEWPDWKWSLGLGDKDHSPDRKAKIEANPRVDTFHVSNTKMSIDSSSDALLLSVPVIGHRVVRYNGAEAEALLPKLVAKQNWRGGRREEERMAISLLEEASAIPAPNLAHALLQRRMGSALSGRKLGEYGAATTIALEMALNEQRERELLAGELVELELAWQQAEELARIADSLGSSAIDRALAALKRRLDG